VTPGHAADIQRSLELHVFPRLGNHPVTRLTARETIDVLKPIAARGSLETVKRVCQRLNEIMDYGVNTGLVDHNRLTGIGKAFAPPGKSHMPTLKPDQLPDLMGDLNRASIRVTTRCLIEWQLHTMVRPSEAAGARWEEIDIKRALWHIPAERMKKKRRHTVPLSPQALALLEHVRPISGHLEYVFPADRNPRHHTHQQTANAALKRIGYGGLLVAHGLRSLASTTLNEQGFDPEIIEAALAHVDSNDVRAAYNRAEYIERRRAMMAWWSDHIEAAGQGSLSISGRKHLQPVAVTTS
jgi:integrase